MGFEAISSTIFGFSQLSQKKSAEAPRKSSPERPCKSTKNKSRNSSLISTCVRTTSEKGRQAGQADFLNGALNVKKKEMRRKKKVPAHEKSWVFSK